MSDYYTEEDDSDDIGQNTDEDSDSNTDEDDDLEYQSSHKKKKKIKRRKSFNSQYSIKNKHKNIYKDFFRKNRVYVSSIIQHIIIILVMVILILVYFLYYKERIYLIKKISDQKKISHRLKKLSPSFSNSNNVPNRDNIHNAYGFLLSHMAYSQIHNHENHYIENPLINMDSESLNKGTSVKDQSLNNNDSKNHNKLKKSFKIKSSSNKNGMFTFEINLNLNMFNKKPINYQTFQRGPIPGFNYTDCVFYKLACKYKKIYFRVDNSENSSIMYSIKGNTLILVIKDSILFKLKNKNKNKKDSRDCLFQKKIIKNDEKFKKKEKKKLKHTINDSEEKSCHILCIFKWIDN